MNMLPPILYAVPVVSFLALGLIPLPRVNRKPPAHINRTRDPGSPETPTSRSESLPFDSSGRAVQQSSRRDLTVRSDTAALRLGMLTTLLCGLTLLASIIAGVQVFAFGPITTSFVRWDSPVPFCLGVHIDAITVVMMTLISLVGFVIARFSLTYLRGEPGQAKFFRWMSITLGATFILVMSCNLLMLTASWMLTSLGLHQLLLFYPERSWAVWAARKKFLISRLGDVLLIGALILTYRSFGTTEYTEIFAAADTIRSGREPSPIAISLIGILFVLGAMTKSAQFPFHSWLPDTMETPTPVSALMHAGVINAGGFLVIRLSPLVTLSPIALDLLAIVGATTALLGGVVMLTQTSIKRSLAYSTISQMGFMMLQCGLGAFSAALLHIVAHSAYKAHAFLSCGSVLDNAARTKAPASPVPSVGRSAFTFLLAIVVAAAISLGTFNALGIEIHSKPGGLVLGMVLTLALTQLLSNGFAAGIGPLAVRSVVYAVVVTVTYSAAYLVMDHVVASVTQPHHFAPSKMNPIALAAIATGFLAVFLLQMLAGPLARRRWVKGLYVHALNGFYIDIPARQITARFYGQSAPVQ